MKEKVYFDSNGTLWAGYGQGSGSIKYGVLKNMESFSHDGSIGDAEPFLCGKIERAIKNYKPVRVKNTEFTNVGLFKVPVYGKKVNAGDRYDIYGGEIEPTGHVYLSYILYGKNKDKVIVSFFDSFHEASGFHQF